MSDAEGGCGVDMATAGNCDLAQEVQRLRQVVRSRDQEIVELRSQLDKYQAVFSFSGTSRPLASPLSPRAASTAAASKKRTRPRLLGISAEPAPGNSFSASSADSAVKTFPKDEA